MCDSILTNARMRAQAQREKERYEKRVAEMAEKLMTYKIEVANLFYLARRLRDEEGRLAQMCVRLDEADRAESRAIVADEKALQLETEIQEYENTM